MMELKTLKDLETTLIDWKESDGFWINLEEVRAEAVKWVKVLDKDTNEIPMYTDFCLRCMKWETERCKHEYNDKEKLSFEVEGWETIAVIKFLKHFFNLTEEYLK